MEETELAIDRPRSASSEEIEKDSVGNMICSRADLDRRDAWIEKRERVGDLQKVPPEKSGTVASDRRITGKLPPRGEVADKWVVHPLRDLVAQNVRVGNVLAVKRYIMRLICGYDVCPDIGASIVEAMVSPRIKWRNFTGRKDRQ